MAGEDNTSNDETPLLGRRGGQPHDQPQQPSGSHGPHGGGGSLLQSALAHYSLHKTDALLMITRVSTILFSLMYLLPFGGSYAFYKKALIANAATSALRLHQRLPPFQPTAQYLSQVMLEDSCHYLLYSIIFLGTYPVTLVLLPLALFATLHVAVETLKLLNQAGLRGSQLGVILSIFTERYQHTILFTVALSEVILMPIIILAIFTGVCSIITPFIYSRFLSWRYASRRNPYTRQTFRQLRLVVEQVANLPATPAFVRTALHSAVDITCRLAPTVPTS